MGHADSSPKVVQFGTFEVDLANAELRKNGSLLRLQEQPFLVLKALLDQPGEIVAREELVRLLWPDGTFVDFERGLNAAVTRLRQILSDSAESPRFVQTVARKGYRFIAPVTVKSETPPWRPRPQSGRTGSHWRWPQPFALQSPGRESAFGYRGTARR